LEIAQRTTPEEVETAYRALEEWRRFEPDVDLYAAPCYTQELPPEDADELEVRLRFSEFLRWVNLIGWAGLAIGNMQLIAPHDQPPLAAGLAWVRGCPTLQPHPRPSLRGGVPPSTPRPRRYRSPAYRRVTRT